MARALDEFEEDAGGVRRWLPLAVITLVLAALGYWLYTQANGAHGVKVEAPSPMAVNMLPPPPPPPPLPPKPEVEPPKPTDAPDPVPNPEPPKAPSAPAPMTIAGPAQAGTDSFGLQSGSGQGSGAPSSGGTCIGTSCGAGTGGGGGISDAFYTRYLSGALQERVLGNGKVNRLAFQAGFAIKIEGGRVVSAQLVRSTGKPDLDAQIKAILEATAGLTAPPTGWNGRAREIVLRGRRPV